MARPKNQANRRTELIAATRRAINERGVAGLRLKDIAAEAGLSIGLVHYYFPNMDELIFAVHRTTIENYSASRRGVLDQHTAPARQLQEAIRLGLPASSGDQVFGLFYELHSLAARSADHAELMSTLWESDVALYRAILSGGAQSGDFVLTADAEVIAKRLVAFEDGLSVQVLSANRALDTQAAIAIVLDYAAEATGAALSGLDQG